jgi:hypothetical protein
MKNERPVDDPKLQAALDEVRAVMDRYDFPGAVMLVNEQEAAFAYRTHAAWSGYRRDMGTPLGFRLTVKTSEIGEREAERRVVGAVHTTCQLADFGTQTVFWMEQLKGLLREAGIDFDHTPFGGRPLPSISNQP